MSSTSQSSRKLKITLGWQDIPSGKEFQTIGPYTANARRPTVESRCCGTTISCCVADRRRRPPTTSVAGVQQSTRYRGLTGDCGQITGDRVQHQMMSMYSSLSGTVAQTLIRLLVHGDCCMSSVTVSIFEVGIVFWYFLEVGSVFGIRISKYRDIGIGIRYLSTFALFKVRGRSLCAGIGPLYCRTIAICATCTAYIVKWLK